MEEPAIKYFRNQSGFQFKGALTFSLLSHSFGGAMSNMEVPELAEIGSPFPITSVGSRVNVGASQL